MPTRSSQPPPPTGLFGRQRPQHAALDGGKLADILLWRDKKSSSAALAGITMTWFFFKVVEYLFVPLLCYFLMLFMLFLFVWNNSAGLINWSPPDITCFQVSEHTFLYIHSKFNSFLRKFYEISTGKHLGLFLVTMAGLWIMAGIGTYFTISSLLYTMVLGILILPKVYGMYGHQVDYIASRCIEYVRSLFKKLDSNILSKIPRGPVKEKKSR